MKNITSDNFEKLVTNSDKPVLLDFYADWCAPCKAIEPVMKDIQVKYKDQLRVFKVDVDAQPEMSVEYSVSALPTVVLCKSGKLIDKRIGLASVSDMDGFVENNLD